jgi:hypothetical protein
MNKKMTTGALTAIIVAIVAGVYVANNDVGNYEEAALNTNESNQVTDVTNNNDDNIEDAAIFESNQLTVVATEVKEVTEDSVDPGVYATLSNGETKRIAASDNLETIKNYFEIVTYREAYVSPDMQFVAVQGSQFEDAIVQVYEVETDLLHEIIYGVVLGWTSDGLLKIESCNLAGENCTDKISVSAETPWIVETI